ncbi:hypothetical protein GCM10022209_50050 [Chitinophaga oryziterrae]
MRSVIAFLACTGFIIWAHSCDTRIVGVKAYAHESDVQPVYKQGILRLDTVRSSPVLYAHYVHTVYLDTINISARRVYPD